MTLWIRAGDGDNYNGHDDVQSAAGYLFESGATEGPLERCNEYGLTGPGFDGQNYISAYWGHDTDPGEPAVRGLTDEEITELNTELAEFTKELFGSK